MRFRYLGDDTRIFPHLSLEVEPGDTVFTEGDNPDPRFFEETEDQPPAQSPTVPESTES